jgi:hypothetical protein
MDTLKKRSIRVGLLAAPLLFLGAMADGHGGDGKLVHACVERHHGDVRIVGAREQCRRSERAMHWVKELPPAPAPAPGPAPAGPVGVELVDADNQVVGPVIAVAGSDPVVAIRREGHVFPFFTFTSPALLPLSMESVYFTGASCDGQPYLVRSTTPFPTTAIDHVGNGFGDDGRPLDVVTVLSFGSWVGCELVASPGPAQLAPAIQVFAANSFTQPFRVR